MEESTESPAPGDLPTLWRQRGAFLKEYGDPNSGRLWALAATELDQALRVLGAETLTLVEAAALCGYSADHLGTLVRKGEIPNYGQPNTPNNQRPRTPLGRSGRFYALESHPRPEAEPAVTLRS